MKRYKFLDVKGVLLDNEQLKKYMEKIASSHDIKPSSDKSTYPVRRLKDNFNFISGTYNLLNTHIKMGIDIAPPGEWLLDNFYIIEETVKIVIKELSMRKYKSFPGLENKGYEGYARIYVLATEIVSYTDSRIDDEVLEIANIAYQKRKILSMDEIWNLPTFLEIALIENIRNICEKIYGTQMQKYKAQNIIERLIENKKTVVAPAYRCLGSYGQLPIQQTNEKIRYSFIEYMSRKLKQYGKHGMPYLEILEKEVNKMGVTISEVIKKEHFDIAMNKVSIGNSITSIKQILRLNFLHLFEKINEVEEVLKKDPAGIYGKMDYETKNSYRNKIKELSEKTKISEIYIANKVLELCNGKTHIGYYLISHGINKLEKSLGYKTKYSSPEQRAKEYIFIFSFLTIVLTCSFGMYIHHVLNNVWMGVLAGTLCAIPISEIVIQTINYIFSKKVKTKHIPKLDLSRGIPEEYSTFVIIPSILDSKEKVQKLIEKMEVYYISNKSENIYFGILGDVTESKNKKEKIDEELMKIGIEETKKLNEKYGDKFYFLYRNRVWNPAQRTYLGWERKRGLIEEFNEFLINEKNDFRTNTIKINKLPKIKYVITLDEDTNLILESAFRLVGSMAHILNKPKIDEIKNVVIDGYGIIQPRIGIGLESSRKSIFSKIYAGDGRNRPIYKCNIRFISGQF